MKLSDLHNEIANTVNTDIACALRLDWIVNILSKQIQNSNPSKYQFPTTDPKISAGLDFDMTNFKLVISGGDIVMKGFTPVILIKEAGGAFRNYNTVRLEFADINVEIKIINGIPKYLIKDRNTAPPPPPTIIKGTPDQQVITDNGMTAAEYAVKEQAIIFLLPYLELLDEFTDSVEVPNALPAMSLLKLKPPYKYFNIEDTSAAKVHYIVITGTPELSFDEHCDCKTSSIQRIESRRPNGADINGTTLTYPGPTEIQNMENPAALFYIPKVSIDLLSDSIMKPAVTANDDGHFLLFKWYWNIAANIKRLNIQFDPATMKIVIDSAHDIFGNAGVALKVGCVYQRIIGADFDGDIDPSRLELQLSLDNGNNVMLHGTYSFKLDVDLNFLVGLDLLLNPILDSILDNLIKDKYEFRLNLFNNNFLNLNKFKPSPRYGWRMSKDFKTQSFCIGVMENDG